MTTKIIVLYRERYNRFNDATGSYDPGDVAVALLERLDDIRDGWIVLSVQSVTFDPDGEL